MDFIEKVKSEKLKDKYSKEDLLKDEYLIASENKLNVYFAPFDYINIKASVVIVGITPGWTQMEQSFRTIIKELHQDVSYTDALKNVKSESIFAGSMRTNLINMLNELELNSKLNIKCSSGLFSLENDLLHSTSALRYPVFKDQKNYTGSEPSLLKSKFLWDQIEKYLVPEINNFTGKLIIPLGENVSQVFLKLQSENCLNKNLILDGFPHPSGSNGHRAKEFEVNKIRMKEIVKNWAI